MALSQSWVCWVCQLFEIRGVKNDHGTDAFALSCARLRSHRAPAPTHAAGWPAQEVREATVAKSEAADVVQ